MGSRLIAFIASLMSFFIFCLPTLAQNTEQSKATKSQSFDAHDLSGVWGGQSIANLTKDEPPMTPWALEMYKAAKTPFSKPPVVGLKSNDPVLSCEPAGVPRIYFFAHPMKIIQQPDKVVILYEADRIFRVIHLDRNHPRHPDDTWYGDSIGKWDGDTLVVDTVDFNDRTWLDRAGHPHSDQLHLTERFRRTDKDHLDVEITIEDPMAYTKPWGGQKVFKFEPAGARLQDHMCDPENKAEIVKDFFGSGTATNAKE